MLCRTESGGAREAAAKNLLQAGYGGPCSDAAAQPDLSDSASSLDTQGLTVERPNPMATSRKLLKVKPLANP